MTRSGSLSPCGLVSFQWKTHYQTVARITEQMSNSEVSEAQHALHDASL